jgi:hypothetical protein
LKFEKEEEEEEDNRGRENLSHFMGRDPIATIIQARRCSLLFLCCVDIGKKKMGKSEDFSSSI